MFLNSDIAQDVIQNKLIRAVLKNREKWRCSISFQNKKAKIQV